MAQLRTAERPQSPRMFVTPTSRHRGHFFFAQRKQVFDCSTGKEKPFFIVTSGFHTTNNVNKQELLVSISTRRAVRPGSRWTKRHASCVPTLHKPQTLRPLRRWTRCASQERCELATGTLRTRKLTAYPKHFRDGDAGSTLRSETYWGVTAFSGDTYTQW